MKEMQKIIDVKKKFNDKVTFISICLDDSLEYQQYLKLNTKQDWVILHQSEKSNAKQLYNIKTLSGYFLINPKCEFAFLSGEYGQLKRHRTWRRCLVEFPVYVTE